MIKLTGIQGNIVYNDKGNYALLIMHENNCAYKYAASYEIFFGNVESNACIVNGVPITINYVSNENFSNVLNIDIKNCSDYIKGETLAVELIKEKQNIEDTDLNGIPVQITIEKKEN